MRQWVLTVPYRLRYRLAWNHGLSRAVLRVYTRVLLDVYARGGPGGRTGRVTVMPRAGSGLNANLPFHTLVLDGVFSDGAGGALVFHPAAALATMTSRGPRQAHPEGFDLHANVWVSANDRAGLERLCRYVLRPPFAQERLRRRSDGRVALELKRAWHDRTRELVFEPLEFLERLAAMTPRPETNLLICHGVLAPHARWRERVVAYGRVRPSPRPWRRRWPQVRTMPECSPPRAPGPGRL